MSTEKVEQNSSKIPSSNDYWKSPKTHAPQWEDAGVLTKMPFTFGHSLWGAKWDLGHRVYYTERSPCSFLFHLPPENPCYRKKEVFIALLYFFVKQNAWRPELRRHQLCVQQRCHCSHKSPCPFWKSFPIFIHKDQLVVNNMPSVLGLVLK